jgi:hypothetical protein
MTVTMAAEALAWSQETDSAQVMPYPAADDERAAWVAAWAYPVRDGNLPRHRSLAVPLLGLTWPGRAPRSAG